MAFTVKQASFEGPLELLLNLIEKRKLFIGDIALAKVADDYLEHVKSFEKYPIADSANFILIASTLLLIKSKALLPNLSLTPDEQHDVDDLQNRLKAYEKIRELSGWVKSAYGATPIYAKNGQTKVVPVFSPLPDLTHEGVLAAIRRVLSNLPKKEILPKALVRRVVSLEETITTLTSRIQTGIRMSFKDFSGKGSAADKVTVIVSFLAMLELVKQGVISVKQEEAFEDIEMENSQVAVPNYS